MGLIALFIDLRHKLFFWQLYTNIRLQSPMSWGAWTLMVITPVSFIWCALHIRDIFPELGLEISNGLYDLEAFFNKYKKVLAWIMLIYGIILGIYTGILTICIQCTSAVEYFNPGTIVSFIRTFCRGCSNINSFKE